MIDTKEIRKALAIHGVDVLNVDEVLDVLDHLELAEKEIESWKGLARQFGNEADELRTHLSFAKDELNRLRAKIAAMEKQEPMELNYIELLNSAQKSVESYVYFRRFIASTPLENDIAIWMVDFVFAQLNAKGE